MSTLSNALFGRLQLQTGDRWCSVFTIPQGDQTYFIVAELISGKWDAFYSQKVATVDVASTFPDVLSNVFTNITAFFASGSPTTPNSNDEVGDIVAAL